eukprot:36150-Rhodomonas_salina.12
MSHSSAPCEEKGGDHTPKRPNRDTPKQKQMSPCSAQSSNEPPSEVCRKSVRTSWAQQARHVSRGS